MPGLEHPGFPIAEIAADGSSVITKHTSQGGLVSVGTVTAQLLYEITGPRYLNPDVTARFDTISLSSAGADRVEISGVRGEAPPDAGNAVRLRVDASDLVPLPAGYLLFVAGTTATYLALVEAVKRRVLSRAIS